MRIDPNESMSNPRVYDTVEEAMADQTSEEEWLDSLDQETNDE